MARFYFFSFIVVEIQNIVNRESDLIAIQWNRSFFLRIDNYFHVKEETNKNVIRSSQISAT